MDELPELRSDEDVDALMATLRARLAPDRPPVSEPQSAAPSGDPWSDFVAANEEFTATMFRVVSLLAEAVDELQREAAGMTVATSKPSPPAARASTATTSRKNQRRNRR